MGNTRSRENAEKEAFDKATVNLIYDLWLKATKQKKSGRSQALIVLDNALIAWNVTDKEEIEDQLSLLRNLSGAIDSWVGNGTESIREKAGKSIKGAVQWRIDKRTDLQEAISELQIYRQTGLAQAETPKEALKIEETLCNKKLKRIRAFKDRDCNADNLLFAYLKRRLFGSSMGRAY